MLFVGPCRWKYHQSQSRSHAKFRPFGNQLHGSYPEFQQIQMLSAHFSSAKVGDAAHSVTSALFEFQGTNIEDDNVLCIPLNFPLTRRRLTNRLIKGFDTVPELSSFVLERSSSMDSVNICHALVRLTKLLRRTKGNHVCLPQPIEASLRAATLATWNRLSAEVPRVIPDMDMWGISSCLWAMSTLKTYDKEVFDSLCKRGAHLSALMRPADCNMIMIAFARFGHYHPELLRVIPQVMLMFLDQSTPSDIASVMWGFAKLSLPHAPGHLFLDAICDNLLWTIDQYSCQELSMILWSVATLNYRPCRGLLRKCESVLIERLPSLKCQDIANSLWALGRLHCKPVRLLDELPLHFGRRLHEFKPQELSCVIFSYAQSRHFHCGLLEAAAQVIVNRVPQMSHQDVVMALWVFGIFGHQLKIPNIAATSGANSFQKSQSFAKTENVTVEQSERMLKRSLLKGQRTNLTDAEQNQRRQISVAEGQCPVAMRRDKGLEDRTSISAKGSDFCTLPLLRCAPEPLYMKFSKKDSDQHVITGTCAPYSNESPTGNLSDGGLIIVGAASEPSLQSNALIFSTLPSSHSSNVILPGVIEFVRTLAEAVQSRLRYLNPQGIANAIKALGCLRVSIIPEVQALARAAAKSAEAHIEDYRPDEISNLLYGLSLLGYSDIQIYHTAVRQCMKLLEEPQRSKFLNHKVLNSIIASCVSVGYIPWTLVESGEMHGIRIKNPETVVPHWQKLHSTYLAKKREFKLSFPNDT